MTPSLSSFADEFEKIAIDGSWKDFEKKLKTKSFQNEVLRTTDDPKLKMYVQNFGGALNSKDLKAYVQSTSNSKKDHQVKKLPSGRLSCTCRDWQYKHSTRDTDCRHIKRYQMYLAGEIGERRGDS